ncbi:uncharacterized protein LOC108238736 [Kryptolebias marmoratus]|uniref:uncharacterized protein LOC108238736 n=1 Tax=Kryptolebias marmoratus TaxID=37003 RepID=UPI000D5303B9|nr:uncharacterized protein LOC108238736 [Kryptolebias marmoratus]
MDADQNREEDFKKEQKVFKNNAYILIEKMVEMESETEADTSELVDELLHAVFFLGRLIFSGVPESIFEGNDELLDYLQSTYPGPFEHYSSRLPRRSPFSCVLDMIVHLIGQENEDKIKDQLNDLDKELKQHENSKILKSTIVCVSRVNIESQTPTSVRYYGVSMSTHRRPARQILIAACCLNFWDDYVADAVMSYYPQKKKKKYFDGTIQLPADVRCEAFNIKERRTMAPCLACRDLFGLETTETEKKSPYGNCAEPESLSKMFKSNGDVKERVRRPGHGSNNGWERAKQDVLRQLKQELNDNRYFQWDGFFYTPQSAGPDDEAEDVTFE